MKRSLFWFAAAFGLGSGIFLYARNSRAATATPAFQVHKKEGRFEVRLYPDLTLATTLMRSEKGMNGAFGNLFRFITGQNRSNQKIAMTTPVLLSPDRTQGSMSFILPAAMDEKSAPVPASSEVTIQRVKGGEFAVYRYSGRWSDELAGQARRSLRQWAERNGLEVTAEEIVAFYDPPWTPPFLRRNEVLIRLATPQEEIREGARTGRPETIEEMT